MVNDIIFDRVGFSYSPNTPFEQEALRDVSVTLPGGQVTAIIGHTGSGKSTLIRHLNVLAQPTTGTVTILGHKVTPESRPEDLKSLRKRVGIVFQFPESQLFEETVIKDVMFGSLNFGASEEEAIEVAQKMLNLVGIQEEFFQRSPFELSGGQMRRVAIAGVLALEPELLVLDEPTAGLDPAGRQQMMSLFYQLHQEEGISLVLVTHQMEDVALYADHVVVMNRGTSIMEGTAQQVFSRSDWLEEHQLQVPKPVAFYQALRRDLIDRGYDQFQEETWHEIPLNEADLTDKILAMKASLQGGLGYE